MIWARYGGGDARERFARDGNVVVSGVFDWIVKDAELMAMVDAEFDMYRHHLREQNGNANLGWCRNMWHSLVQQAIRQDGVFYALNVAARPDKNWRLISYPYYTMYGKEGDSSVFKHVDLNIPRFLRSGRGGNMVQTAILMDDELADSCTIIIPGFQKHVGEWWNRVMMWGEDKGGLVDEVGEIYKEADQVKFGRFEPVVCRRGDVWMTVPQMIHGCTGCKRQRRVVYPWFMGLDEEHVLELAECGQWKTVAGAHLLMTAVKMSPSGQAHGFSVGDERFEGVVEIMGVMVLGDALVGRWGWDSGMVLKERDVILGGDERLAWERMERGRSGMKMVWKEGFEMMMQVEMEGYGDNSYFVASGLAGLSMMKWHR